MEIRAITAFITGSFPVDVDRVRATGEFLRGARQAYEAAGYVVQTVRLATTPFPTYLPDPAQTPQLAAGLAAAARAAGIDYVSIGPVRLGDDPAYIEALGPPLALGQAFASVEVADCQGHLSLAACRRTAALIRTVAERSGDGFGNLYLAALANCPAGTPFFPACYASGRSLSFALAVESADLAVRACRETQTAPEASQRLQGMLERAGAELESVAREATAGKAALFSGIDFSLSPYPERERSLGTALELLGGLPGGEGGVAAAAILADAINRARFPRCGFSGLMLPVLEDATLAARAAAGALTVHDLLLMSAVCGTGLDTVPLPGKRAGDPVEFDFPYFANSRVLALHDGLSHGPLTGEETIILTSYANQRD